MSEIQTYEPTKISSFINKISFRVVGSAELPTSDGSAWPTYLIGAGSICFLIFIVFMVWSFMLVVAKCCTCKPPCSNTKGLRNVNDVWRVTKRLQFIRVVFFFATLISLTSVALFIVQGSFGFLEAEKTYVDNSESLHDLLISMKRTLNDLVKSTSTLFVNTNDILSLSQTCQNALNATVGGGAGVLPETDLFEAISSVGLADSSVSDVGSFDGTFLDFSGELNNAQTYVTNYSTWYAWVSFGVALFVGILILPFTIAVLFAVTGSINFSLLRCSSGFLLIVLNIAATIFALLNLIYGIIAVVSSDFCADQGGPDQVLLDFLTTNAAEIKAYYHYYFTCTGTSYFEGDFNAAQNALSSAAMFLGDFKVDYSEGYRSIIETQNQTTADYLNEQCDPVIALADTVANSSIPSVGLAVTSLDDILDCNSLTPIYQGLLYDTTCKGFCDAFVWMWITSITLVFGVLLMNTFRRAIYDDVIGGTEGLGLKEGKDDDDDTVLESASDEDHPSPRLAGSTAPSYKTARSSGTSKVSGRSRR